MEHPTEANPLPSSVLSGCSICSLPGARFSLGVRGQKRGQNQKRGSFSTRRDQGPGSQQSHPRASLYRCRHDGGRRFH
jgi:hypothetical protein